MKNYVNLSHQIILGLKKILERSFRMKTHFCVFFLKFCWLKLTVNMAQPEVIETGYCMYSSTYCDFHAN